MVEDKRKNRCHSIGFSSQKEGFKLSPAPIAGDGAPSPLDGQTELTAAAGTPAIAATADIPQAAPLTEKPPLDRGPPAEKPAVFCLAAGNIPR